MSLDALEAQIESLREQAAQIQRHTQQEKKNIASDTTLSSEGKEQQSAEAVSIARTRASALRDKEVQLVKDRIRILETQLDAKVGSGATDLIAFRDAQERAERVEEKEDASRLMGLALRSNDRTLAHAIFRKSIDRGWRGVIQQFTDENPESAEAARDIEVLDQHLKNSWRRTMAYMI